MNKSQINHKDEVKTNNNVENIKKCIIEDDSINETCQKRIIETK